MTLDRRELFVYLSAAAMLRPTRSSFGQTEGQGRLDRIGVQLYTVRNEMAKDVDGTLGRISALGFEEVEFAGYFDETPQQIRRMLDRHGLTSPSTHIDLATITNELPQTIEAASIIGHQYIVMPYLDDAMRAQPDVYRKVADTLNEAGAEAQKAGIQMAYHNHNFEFVAAGGTTGFELLMESCDPKLVQMELDLCWAASANQDPVALFERYPGRFPMVHVKGLRKVPAQGAAAPIPQVVPSITEVGSNGDSIDWQAIFAQSSVGGVRHFYVEHDLPKDAFESLKASIGYLSALRF